MASVYNQGVHVDKAEIDKLKEIARKAERAGQSLILLPPHRSHIDYVTLQWIFFRLGLSLPLGICRTNRADISRCRRQSSNTASRRISSRCWGLLYSSCMGG